MTFEEAYKKTGRVLCITLSATTKKAPPVLINYITAPNVVIASAVLASAAVPGFVDPMRLQIKDENGIVRNQSKQGEEYRDGSIDSDIPTNGLAEMLNCRFFLAAQGTCHAVSCASTFRYIRTVISPLTHLVNVVSKSTHRTILL